ncbi:hypothetical protein MKY84_00615 [Chryseomicrobium sp. FSL W7-1435]|uniref:hypothetical protein n=1 Tax=Chryseomicrobium sp. FSL W7-1435 TaxID=2921704 RepID=UPI00315AC6C2
MMNYYTIGESMKEQQNEVAFHINQRLENTTSSSTTKVTGFSKWNIFKSTQKSIA